MDGDSGLIEPGADAEGARTTNRRSAQSGCVEFITRGDRRRVWAAAQKREIVLESLTPGTAPSDVARRYRIGTGLLYTWRRQMMEGQFGAASRVEPGFAQVDVMPDARHLAGAASPLAPVVAVHLGVDRASVADAAPPPAQAMAMCGLIEIVLPGGVSVRVDGSVDGVALRRVLDAVERR